VGLQAGGVSTVQTCRWVCRLEVSALSRPAGGSAGWRCQCCPDLQVGLQAGGVSAVQTCRWVCRLEVSALSRPAGGSAGWRCQRYPDLQVGLQAGGVSGVQGQGVQLFLLESVVD